MLVFRKIVFYILVFIYVVFCPPIILYALGYIFKPDTAKHFIETGDIYLSTLPSGASIYVNKKLSADVTPTVLEKLVSGNYGITISLDRYRGWSEKISVKASRTTVLDKILLIPEELDRKVLLTGAFTDLIAVPGASFFLVARGPLLEDCLIYDRKGNQSLPVVDSDSPHKGCRVLACFTVNKSPFIVFHVTFKGSDRFLKVDFDGEAAEIDDITELFPEKPQWIMWDPGEKNNLFTFQKGYINRLDVSSRALYPNYIENVRGFGIFERLLYILTDDNILKSMDYDKKNINPILNDHDLGSSIFGRRGYFRIMPFSNDVILFIGEDGKVLANHLPYGFVDKGVEGIKFGTTHGLVLLWQNEKLGILDFSTESKDNVAFEKGPKLVWIFFSKRGNIKEAFWVYEESHVLFRDGNAVFLLESGEWRTPRITYLFRVKDKSSVFYSEKTGDMYYLEPSAGNLASVEIVPRNTR